MMMAVVLASVNVPSGDGRLQAGVEAGHVRQAMDRHTIHWKRGDQVADAVTLGSMPS